MLCRLEDEEEFVLEMVGMRLGGFWVGSGRNINLAEYLGKVRVVKIVKMAARVRRRVASGVEDIHHLNRSATEIISDVNPHPIP